MRPTALLNPLLTALLTFFALAAAVPTTADVSVAAGAPGGAWICPQPKWGGVCTWVNPFTHFENCIEFRTPIKSIGPDPGGYCVLYNTHCSKDHELRVIDYPGVSEGVPGFTHMRCFKDS